jgi:hypothetical protein
MTKLRWKSGCVAAADSPVLVSATRFTFKRLWYMPLIFWHALALRRQWHLFAGSIGVSLSADFLTRTTYTVSVWRSEEDLRGFIAAPRHLKMMRDFRGRVESSSATTWQTEKFDLILAWREARARLSRAA